MMAVPIRVSRMPKYLSPTAIAQANTQPHSFFAIRLTPPEFSMQREPTNIAMAVGTMFDIEIKKILHREYKVKCAIPFEQVEATVPPTNLVREASNAMSLLMAPYRRSRMHMTAGFYQVEGVFNKEYTFTDKCGIEQSIPLLGKLDAIVKDPVTGMLVPLDWKCSGYSSTKGTSPKPGYKRLWNGESNQWEKPHKNYFDGMPVTTLGIDWARQFTLYAIMLNESLGIPFGTPTPVWVHHPIFAGINRVPKIAEYRAIATKEIQEFFWNEAVDLWNSLKDESFLSRLKFQGEEEDEFAYSAVCSYAYECECFFRPPAKTANELQLEKYF